MIVFNPVFSLDAFFNKLQKSNHSLLLLDYDGTLAPFSIDRKSAFPYPGVQERLVALTARKTVRTIIISGRALDELKILLGMDPHPELWGSHGLEHLTVEGCYSRAQLDSETQKELDLAKKISLSKAGTTKTEIKPLSVALHWRGLDEKSRAEIENVIREEWAKISQCGHLELHDFDGGLEIRPKGKSKGDVIKSLLKMVTNDTIIAYLGDDATDEQAFEVLGTKGLKVVVREAQRPTLADIQLIPPDELLFFLDRWLHATKRDHDE